MKASDFLAEFSEDEFPSELGVLQFVHDFDPPLKNSELLDMQRQGLIWLSDDWKRFRLTMKATRMKEAMK